MAIGNKLDTFMLLFYVSATIFVAYTTVVFFSQDIQNVQCKITKSEYKATCNNGAVCNFVDYFMEYNGKSHIYASGFIDNPPISVDCSFLGNPDEKPYKLYQGHFTSKLLILLMYHLPSF